VKHQKRSSNAFAKNSWHSVRSAFVGVFELRLLLGAFAVENSYGFAFLITKCNLDIINECKIFRIE
jgi:hypothetical protein